jgi:ligand-binding SRPBCC domain-containing protein
MLTHTSLIDRYDPPHYFRDVMIKGHFRSFEHEHFCELTEENRTVMRDRLRFSAPFGVAGIITEHFLLRRYFIKFLQARNGAIRRVAESPTQEWRHYLS